MPKAIREYWGGGGIKEEEKRFHAILEIYPMKDLKVQLQELKEVIENLLNGKYGKIEIVKEEGEIICQISGEIEKILSEKKVLREDFDFITELIFFGARTPLYSYAGLF